MFLLVVYVCLEMVDTVQFYQRVKDPRQLLHMK